MFQKNNEKKFDPILIRYLYLIFRSEKGKIDEELKNVEHPPILKKLNSDSCLHEKDQPTLNNRTLSKVTFEALATQNFVPPSPKTRDQSVMVQIDVKNQTNCSTKIYEEVVNENKSTRPSLATDGTLTGTTSSNSAKSSIRELLQNQKSIHRRKSKSQNRARKALRTITFILGMFNSYSTCHQ